MSIPTPPVSYSWAITCELRLPKRIPARTAVHAPLSHPTGRRTKKFQESRVRDHLMTCRCLSVTHITFHAAHRRLSPGIARTFRPAHIDDRTYRRASRIPLAIARAKSTYTVAARGSDAYRSLPRRNAAGSTVALRAQAAPLVRQATPSTRMPRSGAAITPKTHPQTRDTRRCMRAPTGGPTSGSNSGAWARRAKTTRAPSVAAAPRNPLIHPRRIALGAVSSTTICTTGNKAGPPSPARDPPGTHGHGTGTARARHGCAMGAPACRDPSASYVSAMTTGSARPTTILLVEDRPEVLEVVRRTLASNGYAVETAVDGEEGLHKALDLQPDLVVLDVGLPRLDGIALAKELRNRSFRAPVLMLTAHDTVSDKVQGLDAGADDYLPKPFDYHELLAR